MLLLRRGVRAARSVPAARRPLTTSLAALPPSVQDYVARAKALLKPDRVLLVQGGAAEQRSLLTDLVKDGIAQPVPKRENSYYVRTDPKDVARAEQDTFICSKNKDDAGPNNNWVDPAAMREKMRAKYTGSMQGRTMYVIPFSMGPLDSPLSKLGVQITDSSFVVANMNIMARTGDPVVAKMGEKKSKGANKGEEAMRDEGIVRCLHSVGVPLQPGQKGPAWPCNLANRAVVHFPESLEIQSFGSGYGGNSLLGKKCLALRIASWLGQEEGWLAEHMLILGLTSPQGKKHYIAAAFPSACGKTNLAMMKPTLPGWKVEVVGDDIAWMKFDKEGTLRAINPEYGFFGVAPGTSYATNPNAMDSIKNNTIFTNVATTSDGDVWWEGMPAPAAGTKVVDWHGQPWDAVTAKHPAAHPNSRFTSPLSQCPALDPLWQHPEGVPISAIVFGGRRPTTVPLVYQARSWRHGVFVGSSVASEKTAAAEGGLGELRFDPFAQLPFCGYHFGDYFKHWLSMEKRTTPEKLPKIFHVNWFRQEKGKFLWPGFGENSRVLKWIVDRVDNRVGAETTPIGLVPRAVDLDLTGLEDKVTGETMSRLLSVEPARFSVEMDRIEAYHKQFEPRLPQELKDELATTRAMLHNYRP